MRDNFQKSLTLVLLTEGGFVDDREDPGGPTNKGITQRVYDHWRDSQLLGRRSVRGINSYEIGKIYEELYWSPVQGDKLPSGVDYAVFDFAVNSGVNRASRYLQRVIGAGEDGHIGPMTLEIVNNKNPMNVIHELCALRQAFLEQLPTYHRFGDGWKARVKEVESDAKGMAA